MTRIVLATAATVLGTTITVTLQDGFSGCCACAYAQTQSAAHEPTMWDHNGSIMSLIEDGSAREFYYQKPRLGMLEAGAHPGALLFRGQVDSEQYSGTAYIFNPQCGRIAFQVTGTVLDNDTRIVLTGQVPQVGRNCRAYASYATNLEFRRLNSTEARSSQVLFDVAPIVEPARSETPMEAEAPIIEPSRSETPTGVEGEASSVQKSRSETPGVQSQNSPNEVNSTKVSSNTPTARLPVTNGVSSAAKDLDNYVWVATLIAVIFLVWAAVMLAAA